MEELDGVRHQTQTIDSVLPTQLCYRAPEVKRFLHIAADGDPFCPHCGLSERADMSHVLQRSRSTEAGRQAVERLLDRWLWGVGSRASKDGAQQGDGVWYVSTKMEERVKDWAQKDGGEAVWLKGKWSVNRGGVTRSLQTEEAAWIRDGQAQ